MNDNIFNNGPENTGDSYTPFAPDGLSQGAQPTKKEDNAQNSELSDIEAQQEDLFANADWACASIEDELSQVEEAIGKIDEGNTDELSCTTTAAGGLSDDEWDKLYDGDDEPSDENTDIEQAKEAEPVTLPAAEYPVSVPSEEEKPSEEAAAEALVSLTPAEEATVAQVTPAVQTPAAFTPPAPQTPAAPAAPTPAAAQTAANPYAAPAQQTYAAPVYNPYVARTAAQGQTQFRQDQYQQAYSPLYQRPAAPVTVRPPEEPEKKSGKAVMIVLIVICFIIAIVGVVLGVVGLNGKNGTDNNTDSTSASDVTSLPDDSNNQVPPVTDNIDVSTTVPDEDVPNSVFVAEKVRPSVVGVMAYYDGVLSGEGSGVLMSEKDGWTYVITCAHVINKEDETFGILLLDGTTYEAELVAYDDRTDIGVLKVEKTGLPLAEFGDSTALKVGEPIYAIGNPGGSEYFGSITDGIVASIDRSVTSTYTMTCIQHNAAINPGNSGGALVNTSGQVVGINSSKIASTEYEGMGFAVPTSIAAHVVDSLISYGYVPNRPKLGIEYAPVSSYQLYSIIVSIKGLPQESLVIASIAPDSSLANTDAEVGDLIIAVNGENMDDSSVLLDIIETGAVGDTLTLTLCRIDNRTYRTTTFDVTVTLVEDKGSN